MSDAPMKITFLVSAHQDPQLYNWLQTHPYKTTSSAVRALLNIGAAAMVTLGEHSPRQTASPDAAPSAPTNRIRKSKPQTTTHHPVVQISQNPLQEPLPAVHLPPVMPLPPATVQQATPSPSSPKTIAPSLAIASSNDSNIEAAMDALSAFDKRF